MQSHFDTTSYLYKDLSFMKCAGHTFYVSILKGFPDGHDCCSEEAKTGFSLPLLHMLTVVPNIYLFHSCSLPGRRFCHSENFYEIPSVTFK